MKDKGRNRNMKIGIANDHSAVDMKNEIVEYLESLGHEVVNYGTVNGIRAVVCSDPYTARMAKEHNDANVIAFGARVIGIETAKCIVDEWLNAKFEGGRHATRVDMIMDVEKRNHNL